MSINNDSQWHTVMPKITDPDLARPQSSAPLVHPHDNVAAQPTVVAAVAPSTSFFQDYKVAIIIAVVILIIVMIVFVYVSKNGDKTNPGAKAKLTAKSKALPKTPPGSTPETINMDEIKRLRSMRIRQKAAEATRREEELAQQATSRGPANPVVDEQQGSTIGAADNVSTVLQSDGNVNEPINGAVAETGNGAETEDADAMFNELIDENEDLGDYSEEN